jgi:murein DD-endopeptidase MepM/ murein hydrolase activator NlpD
MRWRLVLVLVALPLTLWAALPMSSRGAPSAERAAKLEQRLEATRERIGRKRGAERVLTSDLARYTRRIGALEGRIDRLGRRQAALQVDLDRKRAELERIRGRLRAERARLVRLRARLTETRRALADRLVQMYKAERPDVVTVVLEADGFADLLERGEFLERVSDQDRRVVTIVRDARREAIRTERRLDELEGRQQAVTTAVLSRRDAVSATRGELVGTRVGLSRTRAGKAAALSKVRADRGELERHAHELEREGARVRAALRRVQAASRSSFSGSAAVSAGAVRQGSGSMIWPVNGPLTSTFGPRWGRLHAGVDVGAAEGTPIRAADSGRVVLLGWTGGYGNHTCVQHTASMSTCYAHQSRYGTSNGASVRKGQVIGYVGNTGNSFGAHLHFEVRVNGSPVDPMGYL